MNHVEHDFDPTKFGFPPPLTRKQGLARWAADHEIHEKYPNQYVAYIDIWDGEELNRRILWTAGTSKEYARLIGQLDPEMRRKVTAIHTGEPDVLFAPVAFLE